jgi:hemolysin activation/secretion protein
LPSIDSSISQPGGARQLLPELQPGPLPIAPLALPPVSPPRGERLSGGARFLLKEVRFEGNSVLSSEELRAVAAPYVGNRIDTGQLEELRNRLTLAYVERGYVNSGAVLPDQDVADGSVLFHIIEGRLSEISVDGLKRLDERYVRNRLARGVGPPLRIDDVERRLQLLLQDPLIERLNVELLPGIAPGEARLRVVAAESSPYSLSASVANSEAPNVGSERGEVNGIVRNLTGWGDAVSLRYGRTRGIDDYAVAAVIPVTADDTTLSLRFDRNHSKVIAEAFQPLRITGRSTTMLAGITHPVWRTPTSSVNLSLTMERRESKTSLLGEPFPFAPGSVEGISRATILRFGQEWLNRSASRASAARSTFSFGLDLFDATETDTGPNGTYTAWLGQLQHVEQLADEVQLVLRGDLQLAFEPLLTFDQLSIGGANTVRGYRENRLVRDSGAFVSAEARITVLAFQLPDWLGENIQSVIQLAPFADWGSGWNKRRETPRPRDISSVGLGLRWEAAPRFSAQLYWGKALRDFDEIDRDLQDQGIHFRVVARLY